MFGFSTLKAIATGIAKPFAIVGTAVCDMYATIKSKVIRQRTPKANLTGFTNNVDAEAAREKWVAPRISCPARVVTSKSSKASNFDIEARFFEVIEKEEPPPRPTSIRKNRDDLLPLSPPPPFEVEADEKVDEPFGECNYTPIYQRRRSRLNPAREMLKTCTRNARVSRARAHRHSILFGDEENPGLIDSITIQPDTSLDVPNVFARSDSQQKRIHRARAIRHRILFDRNIEISHSNSEGEELTATAVEAGEEAKVPTVEGEVGSEPEFDTSDFSYFTAESCDDLCTPPSSPVKRARIIKSDSYGGSINYSFRLSRNSEEFEAIMERMKQLYHETSDLVDAQALEEASLGL